MSPERFRQIEELYHAAREGTPSERVALLERTDPELRREVESLLAKHGDGPLGRPALEAAAVLLASPKTPLEAGQTIDRYRILGPLGEGGMGTVYTAQDSRLGRTAALKFLREEFTGDREALERFRREARALSALNHPNICTIHDIGESSGRTFIAMEYVEGKRLDQLIGRKGLPLHEALKYAIQIADGLAKAHAAGIVHRDLKPGNIMVSAEGSVKILDFGLAKLTKQDAATDVTQTQTESGMIVGTVSYMSPEQAQGRRVDSRSDIFSFGAVLYEMLTGRRAFQGDTQVSILAAVTRDEPPPLNEVATDTPSELVRIVARCLRKDPDRRLQTSIDLKVALQEVTQDSPATPTRRRVAVRLIALGALCFFAAAFLLWVLTREVPRHRTVSSIKRLTSDSGLTTHPAISPDGKLVAYASDRGGDNNLDIWVQQVAGGQPIRLTTDPANDDLPSFSPDGSKIVFHSERDGGGVYVISSLGGEERLLAKGGLYPRFSPDGAWIAYSDDNLAGAKIYIVSSMGGSAREFRTQINSWAGWPTWSPDGRYLIFFGGAERTGWDWWVAPVEGGEAVQTGAASDLPRFGVPFPSAVIAQSQFPFGLAPVPSAWTGDRIVFAASVDDSSNLWQVPIRSKQWRIIDPPERLTNGSDHETYLSLASNGRLVFATSEHRVNLWTLPINPYSGKVSGKPEQLTRSGIDTTRPSVSSDGRRLVFLSDRSGNYDVWLRDMESGKETAITDTPWTETHPVITDDGSKVAWVSFEQSTVAMHVLALGKGLAETICDDCGLPLDWSRDGRKILFSNLGPSNHYSSMDIVTRERVDIIRHSVHTIYRAHFSPDSNWLSFHIPGWKRGVSPVFIAPLRNGMARDETQWVRVTDGRGNDADPWWSPDMGTLYFLSKRDGSRCIWAQHLDKTTRTPVGPPFAVYHFHDARLQAIGEGFGPALAPDKLIFALSETTGNIWSAQLDVPK